MCFIIATFFKWECASQYLASANTFLVHIKTCAKTFLKIISIIFNISYTNYLSIEDIMIW